MRDLLLFLMTGLVAGITSGLFGIGGGVVIIPALMYFVGFDQLKAQGTSIIALLPPVGMLAFIEYQKKGNADLYAGLIICIAMLIGAKFGAQIANRTSLDIMKKALGLFFALVGAKIYLGK
jgi:hypothetical protein